MMLDAHNSAESAEMVIRQVEKYRSPIITLLSGKVRVDMFSKIEKLLLQLLQEDSFLKAYRHVQGETACLITATKDKYLYWFSIGDCLLYVFHPELANFGQYQINQRHFYEWVG